jgi:hypothetical protein
VGTAERSWVADAWASFWKIIRDNSTMVFFVFVCTSCISNLEWLL